LTNVWGRQVILVFEGNTGMSSDAEMTMQNLHTVAGTVQQ